MVEVRSSIECRHGGTQHETTNESVADASRCSATRMNKCVADAQQQEQARRRHSSTLRSPRHSSAPRCLAACSPPWRSSNLAFFPSCSRRRWFRLRPPTRRPSWAAPLHQRQLPRHLQQLHQIIPQFKHHQALPFPRRWQFLRRHQALD